MADKASLWGGVIAVVTAGGSIAGGVAAFMNNRDTPPPPPAAQVAPAQPAAPAAATPASSTSPAAPAAEAAAPPKPAPAAPQVRQANLSGEEHAQLQQLVGRYLDGVQKNYGSGMASAGEHMATLQPGTSHDWTVNLNAGAAYRFIGACDNECSNVDIQLVDPGGAVVAQDVLPDDIPVVDFTPPAGGAYQVRMLMRTCTIAPCYAGARMLSN